MAFDKKHLPHSSRPIILNVTTNMHRWKLSAVAAATCLSAALTPTDAAALTLGTLTVQSALGEKLRAEISLPQATTAEINSLTAHIAPPEVFKAQGIDYSNAANAISVEVHRNADGTAVLRLSSQTPIQDPFVDVVLQTQWSAGKLVRSYTLLLDEQPSNSTAPISVVMPQITAATSPAAPPVTAPAASTPASVAGRSYASSTTPAPQKRTDVAAAPKASTPKPPAVKAAAAKPAAPKASTPQAAKPAREVASGDVRVRAGDTAGRIANASRPTGVSLDQMLVAMLRHNPDAFINGNVNRIRAGAVVRMPSREQALETSASEARQIVAAQIKDFNAYRRSLASKAPKAKVQAANRSASGQLQTQVAESRATAQAPDKLTLSKGSVASTNAVAEAQVAAQKQSAEQDNRLNELQRNLAQLNELAQSTATPTATAATPTDNSAAAKPAVSVAEASPAAPAPAVEVSSASMAGATTATDNSANTTTQTNPTDTGAAPTNAQATTPPAPAVSDASSEAPTAASTDRSDSTPSAVPAAAAPAAADNPAAPAESAAADVPADASTNGSSNPTSTDAAWHESPWLAVGGGVLAVLLAGLGYTAWKRRRTANDNSEADADGEFDMSQSQLETDAATVDGAQAAMTAAANDPLTEADIYLSYGRDEQAAEVLKEGLRQQPERLDLYTKLAEIYSKRQDVAALEGVARNMRNITTADDAQWLRVVEMGQSLDAQHPYFASVGAAAAPAAPMPTSPFAAALDSAKTDNPRFASPAHDSTAASPAQPTQTTNTGNDPSDFDLDLSAFDIPVEPPKPTAPTVDTAAPAAAPTFAPSVVASEEIAASLDFDLNSPSPAPQAPVQAAPTPAPASTAAPTVPPSAMDFDLSSLDLNLDTPTPTPAADAQRMHNLADDPLSTKLDLAQEFNSIGDSEGARALIEEVLAEASGPLKVRAQMMLSELN